MTTIVDLETGQVLGVVDGRDHKGVGEWLFARPLAWRLAVQVVAIDPSAAFRKALRMWLPRTAVAVDHFHLVYLANQALTETRQNLSQQVKGRRGRSVDKAWAHRILLLRAGEAPTGKAAHRLAEVFAADDPTGTLQAVWKVKEQLRALLRTGSLADANGNLMQGDMSGRSIELTRSFIGAAQGLRRDAVLGCGGLRESYGFYCEESDIAIRLLAAGLVVRHGTSDPVVHCPNADREPLRRRQLRWRSELRFKWCHTPALLLVPVVGGHLGLLMIRCGQFGGLRESIRLGFTSWRDVLKSRSERKGVDIQIYFLWRRLAKIPRLTLGAVDDMLAIRRVRQGQESSLG
jgi:hypothetical protein